MWRSTSTPCSDNPAAKAERHITGDATEELKNRPFKPEFAGKMNFYRSAVEDRLRHKDDQPSIGIILCKSRNKLIAEYALRDTQKPIGVSSFTLTKALPEKLKGTLPTEGYIAYRVKNLITRTGS